MNRRDDETTRRVRPRRPSEQTKRVGEFAADALQRAAEDGAPSSYDVAMDAAISAFLERHRHIIEAQLEEAWRSKLAERDQQLELLREENGRLRTELSRLRGGR